MPVSLAETVKIRLPRIVGVEGNPRHRGNILQTAPDAKHAFAVPDVIEAVAAALDRDPGFLLPVVLAPGKGAMGNVPFLRRPEHAVVVGQHAQVVS